MKKTFLKVIGTAMLAVLTLTICTQISALTQESFKQEQSSELMKVGLSLPRDSTTGLEGSWNSLVTFRNCRTGAVVSPTFPAMNTFMQGGTLQEFGVGTPGFRGPGHGVWNYAGGFTFLNTFQFFRLKTDGTFSERVVVRRQIELHQDNVYNATSSIEVYDANGNLVNRGCATETATRFQ
jgi:hypothetical protein